MQIDHHSTGEKRVPFYETPCITSSNMLHFVEKIVLYRNQHVWLHWILLLASSLTLGSTTVVYCKYCMMSFTGLMSPIRYNLSSQCSCINICIVFLRDT